MIQTSDGDFSKLKEMLNTHSSDDTMPELCFYHRAHTNTRHVSREIAVVSGVITLEKAFSYRNGMLNPFYNIINHGQTFLPDKSLDMI